MRTPVVLILFNRAETTKAVWEALRRAKPSRLFVIADGPRPSRPGEAEKCREARSIVETLDWDCQLEIDFSDRNLGCRARISSGLDWVFSQVEEAIILEDDCVPDPSFFGFCDALLERYRDDERIMHISGSNYLFGHFAERHSLSSYYFSRYNHSWGWATWRRAWAHYDAEMSRWPLLREQNGLADILVGDEWAIPYWKRIFDQVSAGRIDSWAYIWTFSCWINHGLTILPTVNLISNIGFHAQGSHTLNRYSRFAKMATGTIELPLQEPPYLIRDHEADRYIQRHNFRDHLLLRVARWGQRSLLHYLEARRASR
jgi:hypothetical protein